jgi:glycosyltransferase involved in cell wall biosynthesis
MNNTKRQNNQYPSQSGQSENGQSPWQWATRFLCHGGRTPRHLQHFADRKVNALFMTVDVPRKIARGRFFMRCAPVADNRIFEPMKVCAIGLRGVPNVAGGIETHCQHLYAQLAQLRPQDAYVIIGRSPYVGKQEYDYVPRVRVLPLAAARNGYVETITNTFLGILAARFRVGADIAHIHAIGPGLLVPLARLLGLRVVLTHHGDDYRRAKWNGFAKLTLRIGEQLGVRFAGAVIAVSPSLAERLKAEFPGRADRIHYIPNGADHFGRATDDRTDYLGRFGLTAGQFVVSVGRLVPEKGFDDLVLAHRQSGSTLPLVIVGGHSNSDYDAKLKALAGEGVIFTESLPSDGVAALVRNARLFVLASHHEGLPIAALEALAVGAPILLSDITPNTDIGLDAEHYFSVGVVEQLAARLNEAIAAPPRSPLHPRFNWTEIAWEVAGVYDTLVGVRAERTILGEAERPHADV